uniref:Uncharacterized protein n=1 Tax=Rhipicephalus zambeziensis TaxID=60191 RepID=A0A224YAR2_9ACAR
MACMYILFYMNIPSIMYEKALKPKHYNRFAPAKTFFSALSRNQLHAARADRCSQDEIAAFVEQCHGVFFFMLFYFLLTKTSFSVKKILIALFAKFESIATLIRLIFRVIFQNLGKPA